MKFKNTLILLVVAAAIYAFIHFFESRQPTTHEAAERAGRVMKFDRDRITSFTIKNTDTKIEFVKRDGVWFMEKPVKDRADSLAISQLFTTAEALKADQTIAADKQSGGKEPLKEYGLVSPETRLTFRGGDRPIEILFGKDAAIEGKTYIRLDDAKVAYVIGNDLKNQITKKLDEFRDHKLTDVIATQVKKVLLKSAAGEIELEKRDQHWSLTKPFKARGNDPKIGDMIAQAANARVDSFVADAGNPGMLGLQEPRGTMALWTEGAKEPVIMQIGKPLENDKEKIYVKLPTRESVLVVPKSLESLLETKPNDVRDPNLVRVESDIVDRISIEGAGREKIVVARKGESWVRMVDGKEQAINVAAAARLLGELQKQQVVKFVADVATELPKYGLDQPQVKVTLSSYASENTAETKAGEKPIVSVLFGNMEGDSIYAKLDDEPFVVSVSKTILDFALADPLQWQDLAIYKNKPDDITALEIARDGQPTVTLERDKDQKWVLAKGDGKVNQTNVQSLVNTLATLRAVRWAGATIPEHGLGLQKLVIAFKTVANGPGRLSLGASTPDSLVFAGAEGLTGTFALSQPDVSAFQLPLIEPAAGAATPAAPGPPTLENPSQPIPPAPGQPVPPAPPN